MDCWTRGHAAHADAFTLVAANSASGRSFAASVRNTGAHSAFDRGPPLRRRQQRRVPRRAPCADDGVPVCWGAQPADPDADLPPVDLGQASPPDGERLVAINSGAYHTCGLREDGTAVCWGAQLNDELTDGGQVGWGQSSPPADEVFVAISSGGHHTCGLRADGQDVCWGKNEDGQASPPDDERLVAISSGGYHTCGLREDGQAVCWGPEPHGGAYGGWSAPPDDPLVALDQHLGNDLRPTRRTAERPAGAGGRTWSTKAPIRPGTASSP